MKKFLAVIVILALALGGLWLWSGGDPMGRLAGDAPPPPAQAPAEPPPPAQQGANAAADAAA
ncbi:hypothetical protein MR829_22665, partial [Paracoccus versutus]|nr:hypothetical protein [Paracoccus versutus]